MFKNRQGIKDFGKRVLSDNEDSVESHTPLARKDTTNSAGRKKGSSSKVGWTDRQALEWSRKTNEE